MTDLHFTLKTEVIQNLIEISVEYDVSKNILMRVFNQLMEEQRTQYVQAKDYESSNQRVSQQNVYYEREWITRIGT